MDTVDLWTLRLRPVPADAELLDERERARLERLRVEDKKAQFLAAQAGLRRILGDYLGVGPGEVVFEYGEHGKPSVPAAPELGFNLSHSGQLAIVGVAESTEIGVDLEWMGRDRPFLRLARRYFAPPEHEWLARVPEGGIREGFYRTWTLKEAFLKAIGTGLTVPPSSFRLRLDAAPPELETTPDESSPADWTFATPSVKEGYAAALCWRGAERRIRTRHAD